MTTLLITGSRNTTPAMLDYARRWVQRAKERGYAIVVGDAEGVDAVVMDECAKTGVHCTVYGAYGKLRRRAPKCAIVVTKGSYPQRDARMAQDCTMCVGIWNNESNGTIITIKEAKRLNRSVELYGIGNDNQMVLLYKYPE